MDFSLTEEQQRLRDGTIKFAREHLNDGLIERDRQHQFPLELWRQCGDMRLTGLPVPEQYGGLGVDPLTTAIVLEALGYGCRDSGLVFAVCAHLVAATVPIWRFGTDTQKKRYLPGLCSGELIGANAITEPATGSDAFAMRARAVRDGHQWVINGVKTFTSNGPVADLLLVFAMTDPDKGYHGGASTFLIPRGTPGVQAGQPIEKMGLRTAPMCEVFLEDVRVDDDAVLGGVGGGASTFAHAMDWERIVLFAAHVGTMARLLEQSIEYARTRKQFGQAIGKFQGVAHPIADMKVRLEAAKLLVYRAASMLDRSRNVSMYASLVKLFVSESLLESALAAVQVHGGYGYSTEYEVERALRDAVGSRIYSGTSEMQRNIVARWLGL